MEVIARFYPPLDERKPIPAIYLPATFALTLLPFFSSRRRLAAWIILPIIVWMCVLAPCYTFGDPSADFYRSSGFIIMPLWFVDFAILSSQDGNNALLYVGNSKGETTLARRIEDCPSIWSKLRWAYELMIPSHRGIGWNWQIRNVPDDPVAYLSNRRWVLHQIKKAVVAYIGSILMLVTLGFASAFEQKQDDLAELSTPNTSFLVDPMIGWAGALWIYCRLQSFYSSASAISVALGIYERWQLPPLMGNVRDAWSVRQFWAVYHQTMRRMVSAPARRITRGLGLQKGSLTSGIAQLFLAFGVSTVVHQYQMFNVTRRDMGEFAFFMSQPVVITLEGVVMWLWRRFVPQSGPRISILELGFGYAWVFLWFSFSLPIYLKGSRDAGIVRDAFFGTTPFSYGGSLFEAILRS
jgi:hypothetical protein